jgi:UDP-N-acetylmuramoyl-L-alanyl-D-glutamate--2,6-diaminopimelate ligase
MKLNELLPPGSQSQGADVDICGLTADSREVRPGVLFAAFPGAKLDGARFVADAVTRGASAVLAPADAVLDLPPGLHLIRDSRPRRLFSLMAARFYGRQPQTMVAVTGTNGKTSTAAFVRQIWRAAGYKSASLGTVGVVTDDYAEPLASTTPEPTQLHQILARVADEGVTHMAIEASSHGLAQHRLDGVRLKAAAFTNLTRDHLDYHRDFEDYFAAKLRLFTELLEPGATAVVDMDSPAGERVVEAARSRGLRVIAVGRAGCDLRLTADERDGFAQRLEIEFDGKTYRVRLPLVGGFQVSNALVSAGLVIAAGGDPAATFAALETIEGAKGRLELAGVAAEGAPVFIDYAHTPDALEKALEALRPYVRGRLHVAFGCGGDRDPGKRPLMGAAATRLADCVIVTDDNPRNEDPASIRAAILAQAASAEEIGDRAEAIRAAISRLKAGDVLLVAGKGHETGQYVRGQIIPFSDHEVVRDSLAALGSQLL